MPRHNRPTGRPARSSENGPAETTLRQLAELRSLRVEERLALLARERDRFRGRELAALLVAESRSHLPSDPRESGAWAEAAEAIVLATPVQPMDLLALAVAHQANAARATGARDQASAVFLRARESFRRHRKEDPEVQADLDQLEASLATDLGQFDRAERLLVSARLTYDLLSNNDALSRTFMNLSNVYTYAGRLSEAIDADRRALDFIDAARDPRLYLRARVNLAFDLNEAGDPDSARDLLTFDTDLYERYSELDVSLRIEWLEGRIAARFGDHKAAERALLAVRDGFRQQVLDFEVALVSFDLAELYHGRGNRPN